MILYKILFHFKAVLRPLQDIVSLQSFIAAVNHPFIAPPPLAEPTLLQYHRTTIGSIYAPPHRPPCCMPYTIQYWWWQYRVKANWYTPAGVAPPRLTTCRAHLHTHTSAPRAASDFDPTSHADFGAATHPGVGGGTHRRRATVERW